MSTRYLQQTDPLSPHGWQSPPLSSYPHLLLIANPYRLVRCPVEPPITMVPLSSVPLLGIPDCCAKEVLYSRVTRPKAKGRRSGYYQSLAISSWSNLQGVIDPICRCLQVPDGLIWSNLQGAIDPICR